ncbi:MAG: tRNA (adenosine(37)-N6)-threonylcarbamoyltransferase complex dimerization subunit type 1 TsaB [Clostridia bacterium]|nr:tRNA (adenosine(37)-N6)-threonylcarbamoyltransferase complex dimerization subunit type 1 TsaB [Clostridia bacterium]
MRILAIDTSSNVATAAVLEEGKLTGEYILNHKKTHSQKIMPMIDELLKSCELDVCDIDIFAAANGPGSFTGLRIGVATVKGLAHTAKKPIVGVSTLEAMAYNVLYSPYLLSPIMDARCGQVYNGLYRWNDADFREIKPPRALSIEECVGELLKQNSKVVFMGDGVPVHKDFISKAMGEQAFFAPAPFAYQRAGSVAQLAYEKALRGEVCNYLEFMPFYLRKSQAEREYEKREKTR